MMENLKISAPLLSRFDIIFILLDKPDQARDQVSHFDLWILQSLVWLVHDLPLAQLLSEHVLALHAGMKKPAANPEVLHAFFSRSQHSELQLLCFWSFLCYRSPSSIRRLG